jgi:hypothetical protein
VIPLFGKSQSIWELHQNLSLPISRQFQPLRQFLNHQHLYPFQV